MPDSSLLRLAWLELYISWGSNNFGARSIIPLGQFTHIELRQSFARPRLAGLVLTDPQSSRIPSLFQNDSMYPSSSAGIRTQAG